MIGTEELKYLKLDECCLTRIPNCSENVEEGSGGVFAFDSREVDSTANFVFCSGVKTKIR